MKQPPFAFPPPPEARQRFLEALPKLPKLPALDALPAALPSLAALPEPPEWLRLELHNRLLLLLNHVLQQEPQAMERLRRQQGKAVQVQWGPFALELQATPAGLLALAAPERTPDLRIELTDPSPLALAQAALSGTKPALEIQGDVQLAAEVAWLFDNVRWDAEEDLSRLLGDALAHRLVSAVQAGLAELKRFGTSRGERGAPA
ncbi:MAG: SCP2 sterol-binding domain-containing protein [Pseudomonadota bacterium]